MFGYVRPRKAELKIKEFDYYRSVYCGLCQAEKKLSRRLRLLLSYDLVALALLRIGTAEECSAFCQKRCPRHPFGGRVCVDESPALAFTASVAAILVTYKLLDDLADEKGRKRFSAKLMLRGAKRAMKASPLPELEDFVREKLAALTALEKEGKEGVYGGAEIFGSLLGGVFAFDGFAGLPPLTREQTLCLREIGYRVGRFIYILDAYADREEDKKLGKYNPFLLSGEDTDSEEAASSLLAALDMECAGALSALDLLSLADPGIENILRNLFGMGLHDSAEKVILKKEKITHHKELDHE